MKFSRRSLIASALSAGATTGMLRYRADAAEFTFKFGLSSPANHPNNLHAQAMAKKVETESQGRLQIQVFPQNALGDDVSMLNQVRTGAIQIYSGVGLILASVVPLTALEGITFAFSSYDKIFEAWDGSLGAIIRNGIRNAGLYTFDKIWMLGFQNVMNTRRPIVQPQDLEGLKIRIAPAATEVATFKALGASSVALTSPEVYTALQTHLVDGVVTSLAIVESLKWYELVKYVSLTRHSFASTTVVANNDAMQSLPKPLRDIVDRNMNQAGMEERTEIVRLDESMEKTLQGQGLQLNKPDLTPFRAAIRKAKLYEQWRAQFGAETWSQLEKYAGSLA